MPLCSKESGEVRQFWRNFWSQEVYFRWEEFQYVYLDIEIIQWVGRINDAGGQGNCRRNMEGEKSQFPGGGTGFYRHRKTSSNPNVPTPIRVVLMLRGHMISFPSGVTQT